MSQAHVITSSSDDGATVAVPCRLEKVLVTKPEAGKVLSIYDAASATNIKATILLTTAMCYDLGLDMVTGIFTDTDATACSVTLIRS